MDKNTITGKNKKGLISRWHWKEGVFYANEIDKWIVRIKAKYGYTTLAQHLTEEEAQKHYKRITE
jgi:hypothetical protein